MDSIALFLEQHARNHSSKVAKPAEGTNGEDSALQGVTDAQLRKVPQAGMNSVAWVLWHMARSEDVGVHLAGGVKQVFEEGNWAAKMHVADRGSGSGHTPEDVAKLSSDVDLGALRDYRVAVGQRTQQVLKGLKPAALDEKVTLAAIKRAISVGAYGEKPDVANLEKTWPTRSRAYAISVYAVTHNVGHFGEITTIKGLLPK